MLMLIKRRFVFDKESIKFYNETVKTS